MVLDKRSSKFSSNKAILMIFTMSLKITPYECYLWLNIFGYINMQSTYKES